MTILLLILLVIPCLAAEAFFSGSEIAFISASRAKLYRKAKEKNANAILAKSLLSKPETLFSTTVAGTTLALTTTTTIVTLFLVRKLGYDPEWLNLLILTPVILIVGEFLPKMSARVNADSIVIRSARPLSIASFVLYPFTRALSAYAAIVRRLIGETSEKGFFLSREELKAALPASRGSDVTRSERVLVERILEFGKMTVGEMHRPLIEVIAIEENEPLSAAVRLFSESGHSRLPVFSERIDRIVGVIQGFDCLHAADLSQPVKSAMQKPLIVPESKPVDELLLDLKSKPMAIVVNEYGGAEGIITMEDVMEEVVGEIEDEFDEPPKLYRQISQNSFIVSARMEIDELRDQLHLPVPKSEDYQTLGGYLLQRMQKIPKKWDSTVIDGVEYVVQSATDRTIEEVYVVLPKKS